MTSELSPSASKVQQALEKAGFSLQVIELPGSTRTAVDSSALFAHSIRWQFESSKARGVDATDLLQNLNCLKGILAAELPPPVAGKTVEFVSDAIKSLDSPMGNLEAETSVSPGMRTLVLKYLEAILEGNRAAAESIIVTAQQAGASVAAIYEQILAPAQQREPKFAGT